MRDNSGTLEIKNSGGDWASIGGGTVASGTTGWIPYYAGYGSALTPTSSLYIAPSGYVGIGTTAPSARFTIQGTNTEGTLGSEMITDQKNREFSAAPDWTDGSGTWSLSGGKWSHTLGINSTTLSNSYVVPDPVSGGTYQVTFTMETITTGYVYVVFGGGLCNVVGQTVGTLWEFSCLVHANNTDPLYFDPGDSWTGTIDDISVKLVTPSSALAVINNADGTIGLEIRSGGSGLDNTAIGVSALMHNSDGSNNSALGVDALNSNTTGENNSALGVEALKDNTTGSNNSALGAQALILNTTGSSNSAFGAASLASNITGSDNSALGLGALNSSRTGSFNSAVGNSALSNNLTGSYNSALGREAGQYSQTGSSNVFIGEGAGRGSVEYNGSDNNTIIGYRAGYMLGDDQDGNVFLGYQAGYSSTGSNKLYIANSSATSLIYGDFTTGQLSLGGQSATSSPYLYLQSGGNVGIGTTSPTAKLSLQASATDSNLLRIANSSSQNLFQVNSLGYTGIGASTSPSYRLHVASSDANYLGYFYNSSTATSAGGLYVRSDGSGNLLTLNSNGTDILTVSPSQATFNVPVTFASAGDVSMAYNLYFDNPSSAYIKFAGPGYIETDSASEDLDLTLRAANNGYIIADDTLIVNGNFGIGTDTPGAMLAIQSPSATNTPIINIASSTGSSLLFMGADGHLGIGTSALLAG